MEQAEQSIKSLKIKFLGKRLPKMVLLPIPFVAKSEQTGAVECNPVGEFDPENGQRLLDISGANGPFQLVETIYEENGNTSTPQTGEGDVVANPRRGPGRPKKEA